MAKVYPLRRLLSHLVLVSVSHVGAGATSAALRDRLAAAGIVHLDDYDAIYAAARLTPGTNLLALFAGLGRIVGGLGGALAAVTLGTAPAVLLSAVVCVAYLRFGAQTEVARAVAAGSAAALSVLVWAAVRFLKGPAKAHVIGTAAIAVIVIALQTFNVPPVILLLGGAVAGGTLFKANDV
jgi:chromate transport protein ChrA